MIPDGEGQHYIAVENLLPLLRGITSKHNGDCLNCHHSLTSKHKFESNQKVCKDKDFGSVIMPSECSKLLRFN